MSQLFQEEISLETTPPLFQKLLHIFSHQERVVLHGGVARFLFLLSLQSKGEIIPPQKIEQEEHIKDIDLVMLHERSLEKEKPNLLARLSMLQDLCSNLEVIIGADNVLTKRIPPKFLDKSIVSPEIIIPLVQNNDITVNQVVAVPEETSWRIFYTNHCLRDTLLSVGMPYPQERNVQEVFGHLILAPYGIFRLLKFLVEGKVEKIWLPSWMISLHKQQCEKSWKEGTLPEGSYLGRYSLILGHKYAQADSNVQERWIKTLSFFGLTKERSFSDFIKKETALFDVFDASVEGREKFQFSERTFSDVIDTTVRRQKARSFKNIKILEQRQQCSHTYRVHKVPCMFHCTIKQCDACQRVLFQRGREIPCNLLVKQSAWKRDVASLHTFPS
jgi:hypothetical protein